LAASSDGYLELPLDELLEQVASNEPAPGGGFVAGVTVAMAAGLVAMAARLSPGWSEAGGAAAQAESLRSRVMALAELNASAYADALSALKGQQETGYRSRDETIEDALARAAQVPLDIGRTASDVSALAATVAESGEPSLRADAAIAASLGLAGAQAAAILVEVNLATTPDDERVARAHSFVEDAGAALEQALLAVD
jgi:formiminotetrahydrofolate cyclodeaminase